MKFAEPETILAAFLHNFCTFFVGLFVDLSLLPFIDQTGGLIKQRTLTLVDFLDGAVDARRLLQKYTRLAYIS